MRKWTARPCEGRSVSRRPYRLWTCDDRLPHSGQAASAAIGLAMISRRSGSVVTASTRRPAGEIAWNEPRRMAALPNRASELTRPAPRVSQSPFCVPIDTPSVQTTLPPQAMTPRDRKCSSANRHIGQAQPHETRRQPGGGIGRVRNRAGTKARAFNPCRVRRAGSMRGMVAHHRCSARPTAGPSGGRDRPSEWRAFQRSGAPNRRKKARERRRSRRG